MQKKVAFTPCRSSRSRTAGVTPGSGPSSIVMAISPRAAAGCGSRFQFGPSRLQRGHSPAMVSIAWSAMTAPAVQGQASGRRIVAATAPACNRADALIRGAGRQRRQSGNVVMNLEDSRRPRLPGSGLFLGHPPEIEEIKPIVGRAPAIALQDGGVADNRRLYRRLAFRWRCLGKVSQRLEIDLITVAAEIKADHEDHRSAQHGGQAKGTNGQWGIGVEKTYGHDPLVTQGTVSQYSDDATLIEPITNPEHGVNPSKGNDVLLRRRVDGGKHSIELTGVLLVHHHSHPQAGTIATDGADHLEAAQVYTHHKNPRAYGTGLCNRRFAMNGDVEEVETVVDEIYTVMNGGCEAEEVLEEVTPAGFAPECATQIVARRPASGWGEQQEVGSDEMQHHAAGRPAEAERDPAHQSQHGHVGALGSICPFGLWGARWRRPGAWRLRFHDPARNECF